MQIMCLDYFTKRVQAAQKSNGLAGKNKTVLQTTAQREQSPFLYPHSRYVRHQVRLSD